MSTPVNNSVEHCWICDHICNDLQKQDPTKWSSELIPVEEKYRKLCLSGKCPHTCNYMRHRYLKPEIKPHICTVDCHRYCKSHFADMKKLIATTYKSIDMNAFLTGLLKFDKNQRLSLDDIQNFPIAVEGEAPSTLRKCYGESGRGKFWTEKKLCKYVQKIMSFTETDQDGEKCCSIPKCVSC